MYKIVRREELNPAVTRIEVEAPFVAKKAKPGQFIILRVDEEGERVPFTIAGTDKEKGTVTIIFQILGATTEKLNHVKEGECIQDFVGPLGKPTELEGLKKVCVVGGGVGNAIAYPIAKALHDQGTETHVIVGFRNKDIIILEDEFKACSDKLVIMTDDGSYGKPGMVTVGLQELLESGEQYDEVITIGPMIMMKFVVKTAQAFGVKTVVSMAPIMIDGTGMCGCCRVTVGGETKFACVDGPDFDGALVDFDEAMGRSRMYFDQERAAHEHVCNLFKMEVK
ncbi:MAG: sulfide/dihydroorotate dehydrogenase-like FAD/NAD-binding protein [Firmicutes bacterium]|nr:sulfide/dihydroorotate dehydrogenase-like FAD/NAD-binding protein [Bacillota bacterium]MBQ1887377.1 sulfide/dihydroorotate dehydrogenase-like FAD/NAD-binding protein [Bacillota bacterium]MBQ2454510.1 sulfide/dihydroorotate dehydrogenase-like FAD/NAD-binding protein [Bacillota bacterium]MBQ3577761.1 sulfide/dihydroorotate dehydrogenase-like FAD/NAD-binding protein [Bacillota bacterium]MBQ4235000.1 sulfide/dihydroorotate dehydrogenase-like FAD/NAD-binding protein [Bacillota bacterium]